MNLRLLRTLLSLAATTVVVVACGGGGGGSGNNGPPANTAPTISGLSDQSVGQDTSSAPINFTVSDKESDASTLTLSVASSNTDLIAADGITLNGSGGARSLVLTPGERLNGSSMLTVTATDQQGASTSATFMVQVTTMQVSFKGFAGQTFAIDQNEMPSSLAGLSFTPDADDDPTSFDPLLN